MALWLKISKISADQKMEQLSKCLTSLPPKQEGKTKPHPQIPKMLEC